MRVRAARVAAGLTLLLGAAPACEGAAGSPGDGDAPTIPEAHPCPEAALAPTSASLWADRRDTGDPVPLALALPLPPGEPVTVSQGNDQAPSHLGGDRWAWDFAVPEGTPVHAAAPGVVAMVRDDSTRYGADEALRGEANFVLVDHGAGLFTTYVHLAPGSARVAPGDRIAAGEVLAETGLSGLLTGPHLHFALENVWSESLPAAFADPPARACDLLPDTGDEVTADPNISALLVARGASSDLPEDTFAAFEITRLEGLPARLLGAGEGYRVAGQVAGDGAAYVYLLLLPPEGGSAVTHWRLPVVRGAFSGRITLSGVAPGRYGLGAVAVAADDPVAVPRSVRVTVR